MKNFNKRMAAREGFTLVELIVVIAILAILAAVAYPAYTGYIDKAKETSDLTALSSISTAVQGIYATKQDVELGYIQVTFSTGADEEFTVNAGSSSSNNTKIEGDDWDTLTMLYGSNHLESKSGATTATWEKGKNNDGWVLNKDK